MDAQQTNKVISDFVEWIPGDYLRDYYSYVEPDEEATIKYLVEVSKKIPKDATLLEFGSGPTLHHIFPVIPHVKEVHLADYLEKNLDEIKKWQRKDNGMHSWKPFVEYTLKCEGIEPTEATVNKRKEETRRKITRYEQADAGHTDPLGKEMRGGYDVVYSCYCADSATGDKDTWFTYMRNIISLVAPGGYFVTTALRKAKYYKVGDRYFPSANVDEHDFAKVMGEAFRSEDIHIEVVEMPDHDYLGYTSILLAHAVNKK